MIAVVKRYFVHNEDSYEHDLFPRAFGCRIITLLAFVASFLKYNAIAVRVNYFAKRVVRYRKEEDGVEKCLPSVLR